MALAMTRPTKRDDCATLQFKRRTPAALASRKGQVIVFRFPGDNGDEITVRAKIGEVIKFSLRTRDAKLAKLRCALATEQLDRHTRAVGLGPRRLTTKEIAGLAGDWYRRGVRNWEDDPGEPEDWRCVETALSSLVFEDREELRRALGERGDAVLGARALVVDEDSRDRLLKALLDAERRGMALLARRAEGDYSPDANVARFPHVNGASAVNSLSAILRDWAAEAARVGAAPATVTKNERIVHRFIAFLGHDSPSAVTTQDIIRYKDQRLQGGTSPKTIKDSDLSALKVVFEWGVANGRVPANPAKGVTIKVLKNKQRGYSKDGATAILRAALGREPPVGESPKRTAAFKWAHLLCAHSGARIGEIAQLRKEDIRQVEGVWLMRFTPDAGRIKDRQEREVPLHPQVIELGFLEFVCSAGEGYLFLDAADGHSFLARHRTVKNRLGEFARGVVREAKVPANHGWRHAFITRCRAHGVDLEKRRMITGHAGEGTDETEYGDAAGLYEEMRKLPHFALA